MKKKAKGGNVEKYIREELLVLLPRYRERVGETVVFTVEDKYPDPRRVSWLVEKLASYYNVNLSGLRRHCGQLLGFRHHISLPLSEGLVLLPLKMRQADRPGEITTGFVNMVQVQEILLAEKRPAGQLSRGRHPSAPVEKTAWLSRVKFKCGLKLKTLNTPETLQNRLRQGEIVLKDFLQRYRQGTTFTGFTRQALLKKLPNCNCFLRDSFFSFFSLGADD